ncbi:hypothetical protein V5O48_019352, partial [Marasmius crinis-equi]
PINDELDTILGHILEIFPAFGRRMILGHLKHLGHHVPRERVRESYERVTGAPHISPTGQLTDVVIEWVGQTACGTTMVNT